MPLDPDLGEVEDMLHAIVDAGGPYPIQLSGGEPTLSNDLPEIVALAKELGFYHVQINTHGLRFARDKQYLQKLKEAGADLIYMQFDGVSDDIYRKICGESLFDLKVNAIKNCAEAKIAVQLVPTIIPGINDHQIGEIVSFGKGMMPVVKGIHFQPVSYFGRFPATPSDQNRITIPDVLRAMESQTGGEIKAANFLPRRARDSHCGFSGFFVLQDDNKLISTTVFKPHEPSFGRAPCGNSPADHVRRFIAEKSRFIDPLPMAQTTCCSESKYSFGNLIERSRAYSLSISGMPFQDAWTIDLERLQGCCIHVITRYKELIPFCSYYLTDSTGQRIGRQRNA